MAKLHRGEQEAVRERAYYLWERDGRPEGRDLTYWDMAIAAHSAQQAHHAEDGFAKEAEAVIDGDPRADFPALLTKDVSGG